MLDWGKVWAELEADNGLPGITVRRLHPNAQNNLFLGFERPAMTRLFLVEAPRTLVEQSETDLSCAGFTVRREISGGHGRAALVVRLEDRRYMGMFTTVAADVLGSIPPVADDAALLRHVARRLRRWQQFMASRGEDGLSRRQQQGLYGELWFLLRHAIPVCGVASAVDAWTGPLGRPQDFQFPTCCVEVKTTSSTRAELRIASALQLDPPAGLALFMLHIALEERAGSAETLPDLIALLRASVPGRESELEDRLLSVGYSDADRPQYSLAGYVARRHRFFEISETFPRFTEGSLSQGITAIEYSISVAACEPFTVEDGIVHAAIGAIL